MNKRFVVMLFAVASMSLYAEENSEIRTEIVDTSVEVQPGTQDNKKDAEPVCQGDLCETVAYNEKEKDVAVDETVDVATETTRAYA